MGCVILRTAVCWCAGFTLTLLLAANAAAQRKPIDVPLIRQSTPYTCGPAALAMWLHTRGIQGVTEHDVLRALTTVSELGQQRQARGYSIAELAQSASHWGIATVAVRMNRADLVSQREPMIVRLHTSTGPHFSLLLQMNPVGERSVMLADPSWGKVTLPLPVFLRLWQVDGESGIALLPRQTAAAAVTTNLEQ